MEPITAEVGQRLAGRYRLDECHSQSGGVETWRAFDELLARSVGVHIVPVEHDRAKQLIEAAQLAATITEARFLRVLDAAEEDGVFYVVREWLGGSTLTGVLEAVGQIDPADVRFMIQELAEALAAAHLSGIAHLCLTPDNVIFGDNGHIKITGLGVDAAVVGITVADPARADARALGNILYAALTGKWPDGPAYGLPAAPRTEGALATPRQVRAGVPAALDEIADRILNEPPRHNGVPLTTPAAIAGALKTHPTPNRGLRDFRTETGSAHAATRPGVAVPSSAPAEPDADWGPSRGMRAARVVVGLLIVGGLVLFALLFASDVFRLNGDNNPNGPGETPGQTGSGSASGEPLQIVNASDFDPFSRDDTTEHPEEIPNLYDGSPDTAWSTLTYRNDPITALKRGVGFVLDLGSSQQVSSVNVAMNNGDAVVQLLTADGDTMPRSFEEYTARSDPLRSTGGTVPIGLEEPVTARFLLVWFTELPPVQTDAGEQYRAEVADVEVRS